MADGLEDAVCGVIFNAMAYLFKILNERTERDSAIARQSQTDTSIEVGLDGKKVRAKKAVHEKPKAGPECVYCGSKSVWCCEKSEYVCTKCFRDEVGDDVTE